MGGRSLSKARRAPGRPTGPSRERSLKGPLPFSCARPRPMMEGGTRRGFAVPTLFRFLAVIAVLGLLAVAAMYALATFVEPTPRKMSVTIPPNRLAPKQAL